MQSVPLDDGDEEQSEEDVPKIETQLSTQMGSDVTRFFGVVGFFARGAVDPQAFLFVDVGAADGDGYGEDRDVHHDEVRDLDARVEIGQRDRGKAGGSCRGGLEEAVEKAESVGVETCDNWVFEVEDDEEDDVEAVECDEYAEQPPCRLTGEEKREAASRVIKQELQLLP